MYIFTFIICSCCLLTVLLLLVFVYLAFLFTLHPGNLPFFHSMWLAVLGWTGRSDRAVSYCQLTSGLWGCIWPRSDQIQCSVPQARDFFFFLTWSNLGQSVTCCVIIYMDTEVEVFFFSLNLLNWVVVLEFLWLYPSSVTLGDLSLKTNTETLLQGGLEPKYGDKQ